MHTNSLWYVITVFKKKSKQKNCRTTTKNKLQIECVKTEEKKKLKVVIKPTRLFNAKQRKGTREIKYTTNQVH